MRVVHDGVAASVPRADRAHHDVFFGLREPDPGLRVVVVGNCQAESVRALVAGPGVSAPRVPPVYELDAEETALLHGLLARADVLVTQPVRDDFHGHALGTDQLAASLPASGRVLRYPVVRYGGLHPFTVVHHPPTHPPPVSPAARVGDPPVVAYHDLRVLAEALGRPALPPLTPARVRAVGEASVAELRRREADLDVVVSPLLAEPTAETARTPNHPGNPVLTAIAAQLGAALGTGHREPTRPLLASVRAPVEAVVAEAWGLPDDVVRPDWQVGDRTVSPAAVREAHLAFYAEHPDVAAEVWDRHADTRHLLAIGGLEARR